jgi:hypothetical protein
VNQRLIRCLGRLKARGARLNPGIIDDRLFARSVMIIGIPGSPVLVRVEIGKRYSCFKEIFLFRKKGKLFAPRVFDFHLSLVTCTL